ncbi:MAG: hypothetical protein HUJ91_04925 [Bacteroidales bacterium]|nr:hypothetical protein [Bacteroidales bacterium]
MKRFLTIMAVAAISVSAMAQTPAEKKAATLLKSVEKSEAGLANPKKAATCEPWFKLAELYYTIAEAPVASVYQGGNRNEIQLILKDEQCTTTEVVYRGTQYIVDSYADKDLYYSADGLLQFWLVTRPIMENALDKSLEKLLNAQRLDSNKAKNQAKYAELNEKIHTAYHNTGLNYYMIENTAMAQEYFTKSFGSTDNPILDRIDTVGVYYAGLMASANGDKANAKDYFKKAIAAGYAADGAIYSDLAEIYHAEGDNETFQMYLEEGFSRYPQNQQILIGLINFYLESGTNPDRLFEIIHAAQANEPTNASLFYVEGEVNKKLGNFDEALKFYRKSYEIDNNYIYGIINEGILYYEKAIEIQELANAELDDDKYNAYLEQINASLKQALEPFEKAFGLSDNSPELRKPIAEYLKNIYFRFRTESDEYMSLFEKYDKIYKEAE